MHSTNRKQNLNLGAIMNIELIRLTVEYREQLFEMLTEWKNDIIQNIASITTPPSRKTSNARRTLSSVPISKTLKVIVSHFIL